MYTIARRDAGSQKRMDLLLVSFAILLSVFVSSCTTTTPETGSALSPTERRPVTVSTPDRSIYQASAEEASKPDTVVSNPVNSTVVTPQYSDAQGNATTTHMGNAVIVLAFPPVPAGIVGRPEGSAIAQVRAGIGEQVSIHFSEWIVDIEGRARPWSTSSSDETVPIAPRNTKIARIGTFPMDWEGENVIAGGGFVDPDSREFLVLVYVDRACTMSGTVHRNGETHRYDARLQKPGLHWIRVEEEADVTRFVPAGPIDEVIFAVIPS